MLKKTKINELVKTVLKYKKKKKREFIFYIKIVKNNYALK